MKKKLIFNLVILGVFLSTTLFSQTKLIEKVSRKGNELVISYEKYKLPNGLIVLVHEDHSDPIVYVDVTYHVGSAREQEGRSGFAHFFEHMMFQGSEHVAKAEHFKIISEAGGTLNGSTNRDRTNYWEVLPSNQLETALWLESDRMGFLLDSVTQIKFENQRSTVKNERGQNYDNKPYGIVNEKICAALYPPTHPYSWLTIGYIEDLNRVDVNDLKKFFMRWYGPNNATLTISGDVKPADVIKLAEKYFGSISPGPEVKPQTVAAVVLDKDRYISYEDNIRAPQINFTFPSVPARHADEPALDILADILGGSKSSIFYQNFVKSELAQMANIYNSTDELTGVFAIQVRAFPDKSLAQMDSLIRASLLQFEKRGVTTDDIKKFLASLETQTVNSLSSVQGKGSILAAYQTYTGNPNYITKEIDTYNKVTKEDVMRVYEKYIKGKKAVVLSVYPKGKASVIAQADNYTPPARNINSPEAAEYKNLVYNKAKDTFDRKIKPTAGANPVVKAPNYWTQNFDNGLKLIGAKSDEIPSVTIQLYIEAGHRYEQMAKAGVSSLLTSILSESTTKHSAEEISEKLDRLGSSISIYNNGQDIVVSISSLSKNIDSTLAIANEILFHPKFDSEEFDRIKKQKIETINNQVTQATTTANNVFAKLMYGTSHIMSTPTIGTKETVTALTLHDVKSYYADYFSPSISSVVVVGNLAQDAVISKLSFLKQWTGNKVMKGMEPTLPVIDKTKIYFVNKDKAPQSEIRIGYMAMPYDATGEFYKSTIMNYILGGAFNSHINMNLREVHGFTYGARTGFSGNQFAGPFTGSAGVRGNATDSSVVEFMKEIKNYADKGIRAEELEFTKSSIGQSEALKYETAMQKAGFIKRILDFNLDKNFTEKQNEILKAITKTEIDALAKKQLPYSKMVILVVGDKAKTFDALSKLGYEVTELDSDGNVIK
ncbi:MAG: peptidase M16 [Bacteroidetes bacterium RIFCSPLOWO2_12_FULL_35_15]|nr:MAG: peptidase M16 [Bacteroidetes bacterium RIFCSPLOWO2_12_FULL_35_15]